MSICKNKNVSLILGELKYYVRLGLCCFILTQSYEKHNTLSYISGQVRLMPIHKLRVSVFQLCDLNTGDLFLV